MDKNKKKKRFGISRNDDNNLGMRKDKNAEFQRLIDSGADITIHQ